ncbi:Putative ribonuclease H protein At1g65750 [Linum perenne]
MRAELRSIIEGTKLAWDIGIRKLSIQSDSEAAIRLLTSPGNDNNQHSSLILQFSELLAREWHVTILRIYREVNFAADYLANLGHSLDLGIHVLDTPDSSLLYWLNFDSVGACTNHFTHNSNL